MRTQTPKGFRDYLPADALKRQFVVGKIIQVFQKFGFDPLETPTLEYVETLKGKYGEEERLIYQFKTPGGDEVALKYDQTVPLARVVAQYGPTGSQQLPIPFKRYQIQPAYRGENPQKGRYREFLQCDADLVGISTPLADAEILAIAYEVYKNLGLEVILKINDRSLLVDVEPQYLSAVDKLNKIGKEGVLKELQNKGLANIDAQKLLSKFEKLHPSTNLQEVTNLYTQMGYPSSSIQFDPSLVRGLDYYTGLIIEAVLAKDPTSLSLGGGGRYDQLIGKFTGSNLAAVGFSVGLERTTEAMEDTNLLKVQPTNSQVLVTVFSPELLNESIKIISLIRSQNISVEIWLDPQTKLEKQLKYADQKGIQYVLILGPDEVKNNQVVLKDLRNYSQQTLSLEKVVERITVVTP